MEKCYKSIYGLMLQERDINVINILSENIMIYSGEIAKIIFPSHCRCPQKTTLNIA